MIKKQLAYRKNGRLKMKGSFIEEEKEGLWEFYDENGELRKRKFYKDGEKVW